MQRLVPLVVLLAALAAAVAGQNSCEVASGACLAPPASLAASLLPVLPEARRRNYVPPGACATVACKPLSAVRLLLFIM